MAKRNVVTESGLKKMKEDLDFLKNVKRKEAAENVGIARGFGDLSENSEYDEAKNEQAKVEAQIAELEEQINNAQVIHDHDIQTDVVSIGLKVTVFDMDEKEEIVYSLVNSREVDPLNDKISDQSPVGKAITGTKVGDEVHVEVPMGTVRLKIMKIEKP